MNAPQWSATAILTCLVFVAPMAQADAHNVPAMARIVIEIQHFPSESAKASLGEIAGDASSSAAEKQLAEAIASIQHKVTGAHVDSVAAIAADESLPKSVRELARVLGGFNHLPSGDAVAALEAITGH